jgi:hypothetical protein
MSEATAAREQRAARNQAMFREVNEQLEELSDLFGALESQKFVCECAAPDCVEPIDMTIGEYETTRERGSTFVVAPGHVYPEIERVVGTGDRFMVVEKFGAAGEVAEAYATRSGS